MDKESHFEHFYNHISPTDEGWGYVVSFMNRKGEMNYDDIGKVCDYFERDF